MSIIPHPYQLPLFIEKRCTRCGVTQWLDDFPMDPRVAGRRKTWCKACCGAYEREWNAATRDRFAQRRAVLASAENTPPTTAQKGCIACGATKWLGDFSVNPHCRDGHQSRCKACANVYTREWHARNKERLAAREPMPPPCEKRCSRCGVVKPAADFVVDRERPGGLKAHCNACRVATEHERRDRDRAGYNAWAKRRRQANPEPGREYSRRYAQAHPDQVRAYLAQWRREHPEKIYVYGRRRRARKLKAEGSHTKADLDLIFAAQAGLCAYCGITLSKPIHVDHKIPLSRGGSDYAENLCLSCASCNNHKHTKTDVEYRALLARRTATAHS